MGFWNIFIKVWQIRTSVKIQESIENSFYVARKNSELKSNMNDIVEELEKKNQSWDDKIKHHRKNNSK
jgi:hypothetical protein